MELPPVEKITAGAVGEPGERTFYLQARTGIELLTLLVEKQQVELLATSILEILATVGKETGEGPADDQLELEEPLEPMWRVGRMSIGYQEDRDLMLLELEELVPEDEEDDEDEVDEVDEVDDVPRDLGGLDPALEDPERERLRLWATREQMLALSRHGTEVASRGRPRCQFCGNPMNPEGHRCPAMNGHYGPSRT